MSYFNEFPYTRTYNSDLAWLIKHVKHLLERCKTVEEAVAKFTKFMNDIENGDFPEAVVTAFKKWMRDNLVDLVGELVKTVFFGITDTGYFVAYIPESWNDIIFNTTEYDIKIPNFPTFGHLVLSY